MLIVAAGTSAKLLHCACLLHRSRHEAPTARASLRLFHTAMYSDWKMRARLCQHI